MALKRKIEFSAEELQVGLAILTDPIGFLLHFWKDDVTIPKSRVDLPEDWRGNQVLTREQVILATDGFLYMILGDDARKIHPGVHQRVLARTSRKTGKTLIGFERNYIQIAITYTGERISEGLFHSPGDAHMAPVVSRIDSKVDKTPLFAMMHDRRNMDSGIDSYKTNFRWHRRIEGPPAMGGKNMVGLRASHILGDEGDYSGKGAYDERRQTALPTAFEFWGGVPREGVRSNFRLVARQQGDDWSRLVQGRWELEERWDIRANPLYHSDQAFIEQLMGDPWSHGRVQTQILGLDGEEGVSVLPVVPTVQAPWYRYIMATDADLASDMDAVLGGLDFDSVPNTAMDWMIHADYGFSPSPMVIGISFLDSESSCWIEFARLVVYRAHAPMAAKLINLLDINMPRQPRILVLDAHGRGAGTYEVLRESEEYARYKYKERLVSPDFHAIIEDERIRVHKRCKSVVSGRTAELGDSYYCERCRIMISSGETEPQRVRSKQYLTSALDDMLRAGQAWLETRFTKSDYGILLAHQDIELVDELKGTKGVLRGDGTQMVFVPPGGRDEDHNTDAWRCLARGITILHDRDDDGDWGDLFGMGFFSVTL